MYYGEEITGTVLTNAECVCVLVVVNKCLGLVNNNTATNRNDKFA